MSKQNNDLIINEFKEQFKNDVLEFIGSYRKKEPFLQIVDTFNSGVFSIMKYQKFVIDSDILDFMLDFINTNEYLNEYCHISFKHDIIKRIFLIISENPYLNNDILFKYFDLLYNCPATVQNNNAVYFDYEILQKLFDENYKRLFMLLEYLFFSQRDNNITNVKVIQIVDNFTVDFFVNLVLNNANTKLIYKILRIKPLPYEKLNEFIIKCGANLTKEYYNEIIAAYNNGLNYKQRSSIETLAILSGANLKQ